MDASILQIIVQAGAVGLAILLIWLNYSQSKMYNKTLNNHLDHLNVTLNDISNSVNKNNDVIERNNEINTRLLDKLFNK